jgi:hypothetical protein
MSERNRWFELLEATAAPIAPSLVSEILAETPTQRALRRGWKVIEGEGGAEHGMEHI